MFRNTYVGRQAGFLIPAALVIIVGLSVLAIAMSKLVSQTGSASFREAISAQAFYAAESGAQYGMGQLFFPSAVRSTADAACLGLVDSVVTFNVTGLQNCSATVNCTVNADASNTISFYTISSEAVCGSGELMAQRFIQASAYIDEN